MISCRMNVLVQDDGSWPVPPVESMVTAFDTKQMEGRWFISAGLNPAFDCFDCQASLAHHLTPSLEPWTSLAAALRRGR